MPPTIGVGSRTTPTWEGRPAPTNEAIEITAATVAPAASPTPAASWWSPWSRSPSAADALRVSDMRVECVLANPEKPAALPAPAPPAPKARTSPAASWPARRRCSGVGGRRARSGASYSGRSLLRRFSASRTMASIPSKAAPLSTNSSRASAARSFWPMHWASRPRQYSNHVAPVVSWTKATSAHTAPTSAVAKAASLSAPAPAALAQWSSWVFWAFAAICSARSTSAAPAGAGRAASISRRRRTRTR